MQDQIFFSHGALVSQCYIEPILLSSSFVQASTFCFMFHTLTAEASRVLRTELGIPDADVRWQHPREVDKGDLALNSPLQFAKQLKQPPLQIAETIASALGKVKGVEKAQALAPGYVNVWLAPELWVSALSEVQKEQMPKKKRTKEKPVIVEYSQPNIAKPLAIHHIIGTVLGQALVNLYTHSGANVISWNYIGDWGTQFGKLAVAYEKWGTEKPVKDYTLDELLRLYVKFHEEEKNDATLEDQGREAFRKLEEGDVKLRAFWKDVVAVTKASLADIYRRLHVSFDLDLGESFYEDKMDPILEEGKKKKVFVEGKEGSLIVEFPEEKNMPPYLVLKADGATLYSTRDIAQMQYRIEHYEPQAILILTDIAQKLHFEQLKETCILLGWKLPHFENVLFGRMRFADKSMSTRKGNVLKLEEVLDEASARAQEIIKERGDAIQTDNPDDLAEMMGSGALAYGILSQNRKMDLVFDWDKMLSFEGNSAPYLQYTHARARSILRKAGVKDDIEYPSFSAALTPHERTLMRTLLLFPDVLDDARESHMPHKLANFLFQLCQDFNAFYNADPITQAEEPSRTLRLALTSHVSTALRMGGGILTLRMPERM